MWLYFSAAITMMTIFSDLGRRIQDSENQWVSSDNRCRKHGRRNFVTTILRVENFECLGLLP